MTEIEELRAAVAALSGLIREILDMFHEQDLTLTSDEGYEMLYRQLDGLPASTRERYFAVLDTAFPRHSTETE